MSPPPAAVAEMVTRAGGSFHFAAEPRAPNLWPFWFGLDHAQHGNAAAASQAAAALDSAGQPAHAAVVRAAVARRNGRLDDALRLIGLETRASHREPVGLTPRLRAELLFELGRYGEAWRWYDAMVTEPPLAFVGLALAHLRRGEIAERLGRPAVAADHYARFLELWGDCEPEQQWRVEAVRARIAALQE